MYGARSTLHGNRYFFGGPFIGGVLGGLLGSALFYPRPRPFYGGYGGFYGPGPGFGYGYGYGYGAPFYW